MTKSEAASDENCRISIKKSPLSVETSLKELEEDYESKPEWKLIWEGKLLSILLRSSGWRIFLNRVLQVKFFFKEKRGRQGAH